MAQQHYEAGKKSQEHYEAGKKTQRQQQRAELEEAEATLEREKVQETNSFNILQEELDAVVNHHAAAGGLPMQGIGLNGRDAAGAGASDPATVASAFGTAVLAHLRGGVAELPEGTMWTPALVQAAFTHVLQEHAAVQPPADVKASQQQQSTQPVKSVDSVDIVIQ